MNNQVKQIWEQNWGELTLNKVTSSLLNKIDSCLINVDENDRESIIESFLTKNSSLYLFHRWLYYNIYFDNEENESEVTLITSSMFKIFPIKKNRINLSNLYKNKVDIFNEKNSECPNCSKKGNLIDNRENKIQSNSNLPDFKCDERFKEGCGWAIWIESTSPPFGWLENNIPSTVYDLDSQSEFLKHILKEIEETNLLSAEKLKTTTEFYFNKEVKRKFWNFKSKNQDLEINKEQYISNLFKKTKDNIRSSFSVNIENLSEVLEEEFKKDKASEKNQNYFNKIEKKVIEESQRYVGRNRFWIGERTKIIQDQGINFSDNAEKTKDLSNKNANFKILKKAKLDSSKNYKSNVDAVFDGICDCVTRKKIPPKRKVLMSFKRAAILAKKWNQRPYSCPVVPNKFHLTTMKDIPMRFREQAFKDLNMYGEEFNKLGIEIG